MPKRPIEILLVDPESGRGEQLRETLQPYFPAHVVWAGSCSEALCEELTHRHDLILANLELPDGDGLSLVRELRVTSSRPAILLAAAIDAEQAVTALRLGVRDVLRTPWDETDLINAVHAAIRHDRRRRQRARRYRRLRLLTARILKERRDLRERIDLICQDVVRAYGKLAQEVAEGGLLRSTTDAADANDRHPSDTR